MKAQVRPTVIREAADWHRVEAEYDIVSYHPSRFGDFVTCLDHNGRKFGLLLSDTLNRSDIERFFHDEAFHEEGTE